MGLRLTQLINFFTLSRKIPDSKEREQIAHLVDLPGYGYAKAAPEIRETWSRLIGGYLADRPSLTGIVIVMDARRPFMPADEWLIDFFSSRSHVRQLWLINKCDQIKRAERNTVLAKARARAQQLGDHVEVQLFSGLKKEGVEELQQRLLPGLIRKGACRQTRSRRDLSAFFIFTGTFEKCRPLDSILSCVCAACAMTIFLVD